MDSQNLVFTFNDCFYHRLRLTRNYYKFLRITSRVCVKNSHITIIQFIIMIVTLTSTQYSCIFCDTQKFTIIMKINLYHDDLKITIDYHTPLMTSYP